MYNISESVFINRIVCDISYTYIISGKLYQKLNFTNHFNKFWQRDEKLCKYESSNIFYNLKCHGITTYHNK